MKKFIYEAMYPLVTIIEDSLKVGNVELEYQQLTIPFLTSLVDVLIGDSDTTTKDFFNSDVGSVFLELTDQKILKTDENYLDSILTNVDKLFDFTQIIVSYSDEVIEKAKQTFLEVLKEEKYL